MSHPASVLAPLSSEPPVTGEAKVDINTAQGRGHRTAQGASQFHINITSCEMQS